MRAPAQVQQVQVQQRNPEQRQQRAAQRPQRPNNDRSDAPVQVRNRDDGQRGFGLNPNRSRPVERQAQQTNRTERWDSQRGGQTGRAWSGNNRAERTDRTERNERTERRDDRRGSGFALNPNRYNDNQRNRTYRDGYRDGRTTDRRDDRRDNRNSYRNGYNDGNRYGHDNSRRWDRRWRDNRRYDWNGYRNHNRNVYRIGRYYTPYRDYSYRRLSIGFRLDNLFFSNRYWVNDPWQYRLPEVYGPYRWVRYYDDVLLVNVYSGEVVDVIHDFFW